MRIGYLILAAPKILTQPIGNGMGRHNLPELHPAGAPIGFQSVPADRKAARVIDATLFR
jgi:hypothetical protein